ncbi:MAG: hypothetical protein KA436_05485 [Oligoflexales bacterium]|nr:hypothetical protein [Oligoflexales bacterium]
MKNLLTRLQKDLDKFQNVLQKEGADLFNKVNKKMKQIDFRDNIDSARKELGKILQTKLEKIEPSYHRFVEELHKNAEKAGINLVKIETEIKKRAVQARKKLEGSSVRFSGAVKKSTSSQSKAPKVVKKASKAAPERAAQKGESVRASAQSRASSPRKTRKTKAE